MHELALIESLVDAITEELGGREEQAYRRVTLVRLEIGELSGVARDPLMFAFDVCKTGTILEGARLEVSRVVARARCHACGSEHRPSTLAESCPCGSFDRELISGDELRLESVEVA